MIRNNKSALSWVTGQIWCLKFEKSRDQNQASESVKLDFIGSRLVVSSKENSYDYLPDLACVLETIRTELNESDLIILGVQNTPWGSQQNDYSPVKTALEYLKQRIDKDFNGGFLLNGNPLIEFIPHLFWLVRCNAVLPLIYMSFPNSKTVISLCKYGVMHFDFYDQSEKLEVLQILSNLNFKEVDSCGDPVDFDNFDGSKIKISI